MSKLYVYSTLSADMNYTNHADGGADLPVPMDPFSSRAELAWQTIG